MLVIVPARQGSKGVPGKNTKDFRGAPLVEWSFAAGLSIARDLGAPVVCTTDDAAIGALVQAGYADQVLIHDRAANLADDNAGMAGVVLDVCKRFGASRYVLLQPTSPLRLVADLVALLTETQAHETVVSCTNPCEHPEDLIVLDGAKGAPAIPAPKSARRQDRATEYRFVDGSYYAGRVQTLREHDSFLPADTRYHTLTMPTGVDIDTPHDWAMAEAQHDWLLAQGYEFVRPRR